MVKVVHERNAILIYLGPPLWYIQNGNFNFIILIIMVMGECILIELYYSGNCWNVMESKSIFKIYENKTKIYFWNFTICKFLWTIAWSYSKRFLKYADRIIYKNKNFFFEITAWKGPIPYQIRYFWIDRFKSLKYPYTYFY